jgi:hypothetical protein
MMSPEFLKSKKFKWVVIVFGVFVIAFASFTAGIFVGYNKARFSYDWGEHYDRNFGGPAHGIFGPQPGSQFMNAHGASGMVLAVEVASSTFILRGPDNMEKTVFVSSSTALQTGRTVIHLSDLHAGDSVLVIGAPNEQGQIEARLVRVLE